jgi:hypothetical protein
MSAPSENPTIYTATVTRDGDWWMINVPAIDGLTQARELDEVTRATRELVAVTLGIPISEAHVEIEVIGP